MQQASRYALRLAIRFSLASNGTDWILTDNETSKYETFGAPPNPEDIISRLGASLDWDRWEGAFTIGYYVDQVTHKAVRPYHDIAINKELWTLANTRGDDHRPGHWICGAQSVY